MNKFSRRSVLWAGIGALPLLEALRPNLARAQSAAALRFVGFFAPNGCVPSLWKPTGFGPGAQLPYSTAPLMSVLQHVSIVSNTRLGPSVNMGSHEGGQRCLLTATDAQTGATSVDQAIAQLTSDKVRLPSLNVGLENNGYFFPADQIVADSSGIYQSANGEDRKDRCQDASCRISVANGTSQPNIYHPQVAFERLFGAMSAPPGQVGPGAAALKEAARRRRVVDLVKTHAASLKTKISSTDGKRVEEYLEGVRRIERELDLVAAPTMPLGTSASCDKATPVSGIPVDRTRYAKLLCDVIVRAFQCDATRSVTYMLGQGVSPMSFKVDDGVTYSHHGDASHHAGSEAKTHAKGFIDAWQVGIFAYLVAQLAAVKDADNTALIERCGVFYGSDIADSDAHNAVDMPVLVGGKLGGALHPGGHIDGKGQTSGDLFVRVLQAFGSTQTTFGKFGTKPMAGV
jgi:Protein of unknown function (DUF1552)